jgi:hypothetical protein
VLFSTLPNSSSGDFTVTRATTATRTNANGLIELVPYNLVTYSVLTGGSLNVAPTGWTQSQTTGNFEPFENEGGSISYRFWGTAGRRYLNQNTTLVAGVSYAFSFYVDSVDTADTIGNIYIPFQTSVTIANRQYYVDDVLVSSSTNITANTRIKVTFDCTSGGTLTHRLGGGSAENTTYDFVVSRPQFVEGTNALPYQPTTTRLNISRADYSQGGCPNILLEPQRTNLALWSEQFDNASWFKGSATATENTTTSPSGVLNADTMTGNGLSGEHRVAQVMSFTTGLAYTFSFYVKKNTNDFFQIALGSATSFATLPFANFNVNNGTLGSTGGGATSTITSVGNGWYRCSITATATGTGSDFVYLLMTTSSTSLRRESNTLSTSVFLWGAQLEAGAYATSYIPTTSASVTRNQDIIRRSDVFTNGLITAAGGTWFVDLSNNVAYARDAGSTSLAISTTSGDGFSGSTGIEILNNFGLNRLSIIKRISGTSTSLFLTTTNTVKIAIKWNGTTADVFVNGIKQVSATAFTTTNMQFIKGFGADVPKYINSMGLFPVPLSDSQCIELTGGGYDTPELAYASLGLTSESPLYLNQSVNSLIF